MLGWDCSTALIATSDTAIVVDITLKYFSLVNLMKCGIIQHNNVYSNNWYGKLSVGKDLWACLVLCVGVHIISTQNPLVL